MLVDMYAVVESVVGSALVIWGLAIIVNKHIIKSFFDTFTNIEENETLSYLTASMFLILGLITVWVHNDWYLNPAVIVTLLGWLLVIKSSLWLLFPKFFAQFAKKFSFLVLNTWFSFVYGAVTLILGLLIFSKHYVENFIVSFLI